MVSESTSGASVLRPMRFAYVWLLLGVLLVLATLLVCLLPHVPGPSVQGADKVEHFIAYFGLTAWFASLVQRRAWASVILALLLLGAGIEVAQGLMNIGREASVWDFLAGAVGVAAGLGFVVASGESWFVRIERWLLPA
jgi:VanZ family protein